MAKRKKKRQRIDTMIDAHAWFRRQARNHGEWPHDKRPCGPASGAIGRIRPKKSAGGLSHKG
jgi:hypothetical protein